MSIRRSRKGFTMVELLISLVVFAIMFGTLFTLFLRMIRMKTEIEARSTLIQTTYDLVEKVNGLLQNYTIDYEEYFNRQMVGCNLNATSVVLSDTSNYNIAHGFSWNTGGSVAAAFSGIAGNGGGALGNCDTWTAYGNESAKTSAAATYVSSHMVHKKYACFIPQSTDAYTSIPVQEGVTSTRLAMGFDFTSQATSCAVQFFKSAVTSPYVTSPDFLAGVPFRQPYGQYAATFIDVRGDADDVVGRAGDDDDTNLGKGPIAIQDNQHVQELYLISKDKKRRLFLRRKLLEKQDFDNNASYSGFETRYAMQMLQLKAFDAGENHDFISSGVYDGVIDTWACDVDAGYVCQGASVGGAYTSYKLPANKDDGWVNITSDEIAVTDWNYIITPVKDPSLSRGEQQYQLNPSVTMYLQTSMYGKKRYQKIGKQISRVTFDIQTMFNVKTHY